MFVSSDSLSTTSDGPYSYAFLPSNTARGSAEEKQGSTVTRPTIGVTIG